VSKYVTPYTVFVINSKTYNYHSLFLVFVPLFGYDDFSLEHPFDLEGFEGHFRCDPFGRLLDSRHHRVFHLFPNRSHERFGAELRIGLEQFGRVLHGGEEVLLVKVVVSKQLPHQLPVVVGINLGQIFVEVLGRLRHSFVVDDLLLVLGHDLAGLGAVSVVDGERIDCLEWLGRKVLGVLQDVVDNCWFLLLWCWDRSRSWL